MSFLNNEIFKKPFFVLAEQCRKTKDMFSLPLTPALTIYVGILWVIPIAMISPFRSLYLVSLGLSNTEVGLYSFMFIPFGLVALWLGGYLTDVWGRKKTLFLFDVVSWGGYCSCMTFATNKWWGAAALFFIALNLGSGPAYQCLLIEGVSSAKRAVGYSVLQMINLAPGLMFFPLLGGYWKERKGLSAACHEMFGLFLVFVALGIAIRAFFIPHSGTFERVPRTWKHGIKEGLEQYVFTFKNLLKKKAAIPFLASKILDEWVFATWMIYASLYFVQHMGVQDTSLSLFAQVSAYVSCGLLFFFVPRLSPEWMVGPRPLV
jgi:MFS-type transporter involved in bile tolerance (Atg22 family)